jgi:hypothetical protein
MPSGGFPARRTDARSEAGAELVATDGVAAARRAN